MTQITSHWSFMLQQKAAQNLPNEIYDFIAGGADDEQVLDENLNAYKKIHLVPRTLVDVSNVSTKINLYGTSIDSPILIAPTAPHKLLHAEGELATIRAANDTNTLMVVSFMASTSLETIAQASTGHLWFQLQILKNRNVTENLIKRAVISGYKALVLTVDMPILGDRKRDTHNRFKIPDDCLPINLIQEKLIEPSVAHSMLKSKHMNELLDPSISWKDIAWIQKISPIPILLKGLLHPKDARIALDIGINGIIVSNHGGRQLGATIATLEALPSIINVTQNKIPVLVDGGIRSGTDIFKALTLGASSVLVGRSILWGLSAGGSAGVMGVLKQLNRELIHTMILCGTPLIENIYQQDNPS